MSSISSMFYGLFQGLQLGMYTVMLSSVLDNTLSVDYTKDLIKKDFDLYAKGLQYNYINLLVISPIYYVFVYNYLLDLTKPDSLFVLDYLGLLLIHNVGYFSLHKIMHKIQPLKYIHDFHHLFKNTVPTTGNAVSMMEFNIAYVSPFIVGIFIIQPNNVTLKSAIGTISLLNTFIHCPNFKNLQMPEFLVSPGKHMKHHETYTATYAAPLLNIDYIFNMVESKKE